MSDETSNFMLGLFFGFIFTLVAIGLPSLVRINNLNTQNEEYRELIYKTYSVPYNKKD